MELMQLSEKIEIRIKMLADGRNLLAEHSMNRAKSIANYEKVLGITYLKLRNNAIKTHEDYPCEDLPVGMIEKVAKSICYQEKLNMETFEASYKVILTKLTVIQAEMNALQSINRHLSQN